MHMLNITIVFFTIHKFYNFSKHKKLRHDQPPHTTWYLECFENPEERNTKINNIYY